MGARCTIGLTGDVGAGKSTVLDWFSGRGARVLDADRTVHNLLRHDAAVIDAVVARFGPSVRHEVVDGEGIDRGALAAIVFRDPAALADLERFVHPSVHSHTMAWLAEVNGEVAVVEAVKLVESGMHVSFDRLWLVVCDREVRRDRLIRRGWTPAEVERRFAAAPPLAPKLALADTIIDNSGSPEATARQLEAAWRDPECRADGV